MLLFSLTDWGWDKHKSQSKVPDKATSSTSVSKQFNTKQIWQNYSGKSETHLPDTSQMQETFKDEFLRKQCSSASCLAVDFNSCLQNCCRAAGAGDFQASKAEGRLNGYLSKRHGFISCLRPTWALQLPCLSSSLPPLRHWRQCLFPRGYKHIKEQETNH